MSGKSSEGSSQSSKEARFVTSRLLLATGIISIYGIVRAIYTTGVHFNNLPQLIGGFVGVVAGSFILASVGKGMILLFKGDDSIKSELPEDHPHREIREMSGKDDDAKNDN